MNYRETGLKALEVVGGKDNVKNLTHCATRLRFEVKDRSKVQMDKLNSVPGVLKALESAGQFQFVIGPSVNECYQVVADEIGIAGGVVEDNHPEDMATAEKTEKGNLIQKALGLISGIFIPILPALIASGMIKALLTILTRLALVNTESGIYTIVTFVADSVFYFLPVLLAATSAKVFGMSQGLAMELKKSGVEVFTGASVSRIEPGPAVVFTHKGAEHTVSADTVLAATGRRPATEGLFADGAAPELERGFVRVDGSFRTSIPSIYAIGDAIVEGGRAVEDYAPDIEGALR